MSPWPDQPDLSSTGPFDKSTTLGRGCSELAALWTVAVIPTGPWLSCPACPQWICVGFTWVRDFQFPESGVCGDRRRVLGPVGLGSQRDMGCCMDAGNRTQDPHKSHKLGTTEPSPQCFS